ncbi:hypothetical protein RCL1_004132 [Eukaryota sp. TZLM3-RCL]
MLEFTAPETKQTASFLKDRLLNLPSLTTLINKTREQSTLFRAGTDSTVPSVVCNRKLIDMGDAVPLFLQTTTTHIPATKELLTQSHIPLSLVWTPNPVIDGKTTALPPLVSATPHRCRRCRGYYCPQAGEQTSSWICRICDCDNNFSSTHFQQHESREFGRKYGVVDYKIPGNSDDFSSYQPLSGLTIPTSNGYVPDAFTDNLIFIIDASSDCLRRGFFKTIINSVLTQISSLDESMRMGILLATSTGLYFVVPSTNDSSCKPSFLIVPDVSEPFLPCSAHILLPKLSDVRSLYLSILPDLEQHLQDTITHLTGPPLGAALSILPQLFAGTAGRAIILLSSTPNIGVGSFLDRGNATWGTERQRNLMVPASPEWAVIANNCSQSNILIDLVGISNSNQSFDFVTLSTLCHATGGSLHKIIEPNLNILCEILTNLIGKLAKQVCYYNAVLRVRAGGALSVSQIYATSSRASTTGELALPVIPDNLTLKIDLTIDGKMEDSAILPIQAAMLFTNSFGERIVRVATITVKVSASLPPVFRCSSAEVLGYCLARDAAISALSTPLETVKSNLITKLVAILSAYRLFASARPHLPQLLLPETLQHLPLLLSSFLRSKAVTAASDVSMDDRIVSMTELRRSCLYEFVFNLHPIIFDLMSVSSTEISRNLGGDPILPVVVRPSEHALSQSNVYLIVSNSGAHLFVGSKVDSDWLSENLVDSDSLVSGEIISFKNSVLFELARYCILSTRHLYSPIIYLGDPLNQKISLGSMVLKDLLVEDASTTSLSFWDFLNDVHSKILTRVNEERGR